MEGINKFLLPFHAVFIYRYFLSTQLYNGERRPKADRVFEALGHQDELNVVVGIAREHCAQHADLVEM